MKLLKLIKLFFQRNFVFRFNFLMGWVMNIVRFLFIILFWHAAMGQNNVNFGYTEKSMIIYFFVIMLISLCIQTDVTDKVSGAIYEGTLSVDLLKPVSFHLNNFSQGIASKLIFIFFLVISAVALFFMPQYSSLFVVSVFISLIINFELSYLIGLFGFWTYTVWGIAMVNDVLVNIFGGKLFPIEIAGQTFKTVCSILPYQYIYYIPTQILEGKLPAISLAYQALYAIALYIISKIVFKIGLKRYEAVGV